MQQGKASAQAILMLTTVNSAEAADALAQVLVTERAAACVNIIPAVRSIYAWEGKVITDNEVKLLIKTSSRHAARARELIRQNHPYTVPEITVVGGDGGVSMEPDYWTWLTDYLDGHSPDGQA